MWGIGEMHVVKLQDVLDKSALYSTSIPVPQTGFRPVRATARASQGGSKPHPYYTRYRHR